MSDEPIISAIHITSRSRFGLSNRIRGLAGYYALSKVLACDLLYSWETDASCPGLIQDVFSAIPVGLPVETLPSDPKALLIGTSATPEMPTRTDMVDLRRRLGLQPLQTEGILALADTFLREQPSGYVS